MCFPGIQGHLPAGQAAHGRPARGRAQWKSASAYCAQRARRAGGGPKGLRAASGRNPYFCTSFSKPCLLHRPGAAAAGPCSRWPLQPLALAAAGPCGRWPFKGQPLALQGPQVAAAGPCSRWPLQPRPPAARTAVLCWHARSRKQGQGDIGAAVHAHALHRRRCQQHINIGTVTGAGTGAVQILGRQRHICFTAAPAATKT